MFDVTEAPRIPRRPDATDPDLQPIVDADAAPVAQVTDTGELAAYPEEADELADVESEPVEDGLRGQPSIAAALPGRFGRRPRDIVFALGVLLVVVLSLFGLYRCLGGDSGVAVDPGPAYAEARRAGDLNVLQPQGLSKGWDTVSAAYQPQDAGAVLRVGWRTPSGGTAQLIEGTLSQDTMLEKELGQTAALVGPTDIGGRQWQRYTARDGERALVLLEPNRTIIVVGQANEAELRTLAESLR
jgi:hypothetical protein